MDKISSQQDSPKPQHQPADDLKLDKETIEDLSPPSTPQEQVKGGYPKRCSDVDTGCL